MLSNKSIENLAELLWPRFRELIDWEAVLGFHQLSDEALNIFYVAGIRVVADTFGTDISSQLVEEIVNQLTVLAIRDARRLYINWQGPEVI